MGKLFFGFLAAISLGATTVPPISFQELVQQADLVVSGRVTGVSASWGVDHKFIWTRYQVSVEQTFKGVGSKSVAISEPGGEIDGRIMEIAGAVPYSVGEHVTVFLHRFPSGTLRTVGWAQGKFLVDESGRLRPSVHDGFVPHNPADSLDGLSLRDLRSKIAGAVANGSAKQ